VDALTGLYNRRAFVERVEESLKTCETGISIVYFDLDDLKKINDTYGHDVGDMYINHFVKGIKKQLFAKEIFSRFGGDEFVLLHIRSNLTFESFCNQSNKWFLENPVILDGESLVVNFSVGEAVIGIDGSTVEELIKIADHRMYDNKRNKKSN
jgi:diguanylate cyclase (GGDEF)-like protein